MTDLIIYLLKAAFINAVLLAFYYFVLQRTNKFTLMRVTLLSAMVLPLILPLIPIDVSHVASSNSGLSPVSISLPAFTNGYAGGIHLPSLTETVYYTIAVMFITGMLVSIFIILNKRKSASQRSTQYGNVYLHHEVKSPFSFFEWVFISMKHINHPHLEMLLKHEFCHVKKLHSIDRIVSGIFRSILWFSPLAHITARRLIEVHEYQADANVIKTNIEPSEYSDLVLSFYLNEFTTLSITNNFSFHIKKRIAMINKLNIKNLKTGRIIFGLSFSFLAVIATSAIQSEKPINRNVDNQVQEISMNSEDDTISPAQIIEKQDPGIEKEEIIKEQEKVQKEQEKVQKEREQLQEDQEKVQENQEMIQKDQEAKQKEQEKIKKEKQKKYQDMMISTEEKNIKPQKKPGTDIFTVVEDPPQYPGGDQARTHYLNSKIVYPEDARKKGIQGTVYINFIVQADGSITDVKLLRGFNKELDEIAINAVKSMPNWIPGKFEGKPVAVSFNMPIKFSLEDKEEKQ